MGQKIMQKKKKKKKKKEKLKQGRPKINTKKATEEKKL